MKVVVSTCIFFLITGISVFAQKEGHLRNLNDSVAIKGYDPVAYFDLGMAVEGKEEYAVVVDDAIYYCSSENNQHLLEENPEAYEPEYGGWCAYAMGDSGHKVGINPRSFEIKDGRLYLFYHTFFSNTQKKWNKDEQVLQRQADLNWSEIANNTKRDTYEN